MMRKIQISRYGGPEVLVHTEAPEPTPRPGEVLIEVAASGVNFIDIYHRIGRYPQQLPFTPGVEAAGTITALGEDVQGFAVGDRVGWVNVPGTYAQFAAVPGQHLIALPDSVELETAAATLLQGMTAHYLTRDSYPVRPGDTVLVHAAAGGIGMLLTQMITSLGARVIGTVSTAEKEALAREAGAAEVIRYREVDDLAAEVRKLADGGVAAVYDGVGQDTFDASLASLRTRGTLVLFGSASGPVPPFDPMRLSAAGSVSLTRPTLGHFIADRDELMMRANDVLTQVADGSLRISISERYPLAEAAKAHEALESGRTTGKLLLINQ